VTVVKDWMMRMQSFVVMPLLVMSLTSAAIAQQDTVTLKDGSTKPGQIQDYDFRGVKLTLAGGGGTTTIKADDVASVTYGSQPKEFKQAEDEFNRSKYEDAAASFQGIIDNKKIRSVLRQDAWKDQAIAYLRSGKVDDAVKSFKGMLEEFPQSRYLEEVQRSLVTLLVGTGKGPDAVAFIESEETRLQKIPETGALIERLKILKARAYLGAGDTKKAKAEATALASGTSGAAASAKVLLAEIALAEKQTAEAEKLFRDALTKVTAKSDRAAAFNGLGSILLDRGKESKQQDPIREALLLFLRTALVEIPEAGEPTEAHETGIYNAGVAFQYLGELGSGGGSKAADTKADGARATDDAQGRNLARARENFRRLLREYPQSKHAGDAQTRLQKLGG
jgi:outer membrane protein assembly factor BamD (BamD/ComL family)